MSGMNWNYMRYELLRGGVKTKYIDRTLNELKSHYTDLKQQGIADGLSEHDANARAKASIGDEHTLLSEILSKPELRSVIWRFPKSVFSIGPTLTAIAFTLMTLIVFFGYLNSATWFGDASAGMHVLTWEKLLVSGVLAFNCYVLTPLVAIGTVILAKQRHINFFWPAVGIVVLAIIGSGWAYVIVWPADTLAGSLNINWGYSFFPRAIRGDHDLQNFGQIIFTLIITAVCWRAYHPLPSDSTLRPT